jgi:hypothetical protein
VVETERTPSTAAVTEITCGRGRAALARALTDIPSRMAADGNDLLFFEEGTGWLR